MDPEGVRQIFHAECGDAPDYRVREAVRTLPWRARLDESRFFGVHLPLTRPLPKRLDTTLQQSVGLHLYDAVVLADIDPVVFDADDLMNLLAYVEAGGGLLLIGGPHSFSRAQRNWGPLREALPASIPLQTQRRSKLWNDPFPQETIPAPQPVELRQPHPATRGLGGTLGLLRHVQPLQPADGAAVLAACGDRPVAVAGAYGRGRTLMVCAYPGDEDASLFRTPAWDEFLRQGLAWLMGRDGDLVVTRTCMDAGPMRLGDERTLGLELVPDAPGPVRARALLSRADPGWLAVGREPQYDSGTPLAPAIDGPLVSLAFRPTEAGLWRIRIDVEGPGWANCRTVEIPVRTASDLRLWTRTGEYVATPGGRLPVALSAEAPVEAALTIRDGNGCDVWQRDAVRPGPLDIDLPALELGDYELLARAPGEEARLRFCVTDPLDSIPFGLTGSAGGRTEEQVRWWYDYFRSRGFTGFWTGLAEVDADPTDSFRPGPYARYLAQREGMVLWGGSLGTRMISTHAHYGDEGTRPTRPCLFSPEYDESLRGELADRFSRAAAIPRMAALEILDEPHLMRANVCRCAWCQAEFRRRHRCDMPTWDEALAARDRRTAAYFEWVVDYAAEAFRRGFEIWNSFGPGPKLHHVLCAMGSGNSSIAHAVAEDLPWSASAHMLTFDCYNYMYPHWRGSRQMMWNEYHYLAGHFRFLALRHGQPVGFFIQVTDRDVPVRPWDPLRAPSETLYTAIGHGAKTFHLMSKGPFTNTQNCREEKFDAFAEDIRKVNRAAPLLQRAQRPRSRVALVFAFHDRLYRYPRPWLPDGYVGLGFYGAELQPYDAVWPYHKAPVNVAEWLIRSFGEVDVIDQRALREGALDDYGAFVLTGTDYMDPRDAAAVRRFVEEGGSLIADHVPSRDLAGEALDTLRPVFGGANEHLYRDATVRRGAFGRGQALLFSHSLNELYTGSIEQGNEQLRLRLETAGRDFLFGCGLRPHALGDNPHVEANMLFTPDSAVLVAVNHTADRQVSRVTIYRPSVELRHAVDLVTMRRHALLPVPEGMAVDLMLGDREGLILGLYADIPATSAIVPDGPVFARGGRLAFEVRLDSEDGRPPRGDHLVEVTVTDPGGTERRRFGGLRVAVNGILRVDEPLAVNARSGRWTITAFDRFSTRLTRAEVAVE